MRVQGFLIYRIWYGDCLVYVGRTKQPLQSRIRGHLFSKPMHRTVNIEQVTKIEYAELGSEADMNLYEIYYILRLHPPLNVDDKARDDLSVTLPELEWKEFTTPLWEGWRQEIAKQDFSQVTKAFDLLELNLKGYYVIAGTTIHLIKE